MRAIRLDFCSSLWLHRLTDGDANVLSSAVAKKKARLRIGTVPVVVVRPGHLKPALKPIVEPMVAKLDRHETLLLEMKAALDVQFQRIAALQAQIDHLLARLSRS